MSFFLISLIAYPSYVFIPATIYTSYLNKIVCVFCIWFLKPTPTRTLREKCPYLEIFWSVFSHISLIWSSFFNFQSVICSSSRKGNGWLSLRATYLSLCVTRIWQFFHRLKYHYLLFTWSVDVLPKYVRNFHVDWIFKSLFYFIRQ